MSSELKNRILFTIFVLFIYRIGTFIPLPGMDGDIVKQFFTNSGNSIFGVLNMFSGGAFSRMSIFALNIMPYITASIVIQLMTSVFKELEELKKEGEYGRRKINNYTKYLTLILAIMQSAGIYYAFLNLEKSAFISNSSIFLWTTIFTSSASTMVLMWLGSRITQKGVGNGISLIIFVGIVSELPGSFIQLLELSRKGVYSWMFILIILAFFFVLLLLIVFVEKSTRNIKIQYPNRGMMKSSGVSDSSYIPLKVNVSGVIPPIFAGSILSFPLIIAQFFNGAGSKVFADFLKRGSFGYSLIFSILIIFFCFFYSSIVFNTEEISDNLKRNNCFVPGVRPGKATLDYFNYVVARITIIGAIYLVAICILPDLFISKYNVPITLGGTGLLIIVNVIVDLINQVQSYMVSNRYANGGKRRTIRVRA